MVGLGFVVVGAVLTTMSTFASMSEKDQAALGRLWFMTVAGWGLLVVGSVLAAAGVVHAS